VSLDLSNSNNWNSSDDDDLEMGRPLSSFLSMYNLLIQGNIFASQSICIDI
jgi:hypothetical protein